MACTIQALPEAVAGPIRSLSATSKVHFSSKRFSRTQSLQVQPLAPVVRAAGPIKLNGVQVLPRGVYQTLRDFTTGGNHGRALSVKVARRISSTRRGSIRSEYNAKEVADLMEANRELRKRVVELEALVSQRQSGAAEQPTAYNGTMPAADAEATAVTEDSQEASDSHHPHTRVDSVLSPAGQPRAVPRLADIQWPDPSKDPTFWKKLPFPHRLEEARKRGGIAKRDKNELDSEAIHIVHVTAEMAPLAKVGGLGDVVTGLARACIERGHRVEVLLPFYECIDLGEIEELIAGETFSSYHRGGWVKVQVHRGLVSGIPVVFLQPDNNFFKGSRIYGGSYDELEAYLFFSRACLEFLQTMRLQPHIIHAHEWHTAGIALLYWDMYHSLGLQKPRLVLTIHNMEHHGECRAEQLDMCGLDGLSYLTADKAMDDRTVGHNPERASLLKGGIVYCNAVSTVSPTYAKETLCGGWMASTLLRVREKYTGILNGIDTTLWDPTTDPNLPVPYSASDLSGKQISKHFVQRGLGLELDALPGTETSETEGTGKRTPLIACITRLVAQKGIHLIRAAIHRVKEQDAQFVLLGSTNDPRIQGEFQKLAEEFKDSKKIRLVLTYSESFAHLLFGAADMLLVPSMFEPCGLTQMIAMRYGTVPVVRRTGGLADTVFDVDDKNHPEIANGFIFDGIDENSMYNALDRGIQYYQQRSDWWSTLAAKVMAIDNSWNKSARQYVDLYNGVRVK